MHQPTHEIVLPFVTKSPRTIFHAPYTFITQPSSTPRTVGSMRPSSLTAYMYIMLVHMPWSPAGPAAHTKAVKFNRQNLQQFIYTPVYSAFYIRIPTYMYCAAAVPQFFLFHLYVSLLLILHPRFPRTHWSPPGSRRLTPLASLRRCWHP